MGLPSIEYNTVGYMNASLLGKVGNLKNKKFSFLLHGTSDELVHLSRAWYLCLEAHIYHSMENYLIGCVKLDARHQRQKLQNLMIV